MENTYICALKEAHQFVWDNEEARGDDWKIRQAKAYYDQLYKEFAVIDFMSGDTRHSIGLRWRTKEEVISGKGTKYCGSLHCSSSEELNTMEVPFRYIEKGEDKTELVKVKLCSSCGTQLIRKR